MAPVLSIGAVFRLYEKYSERIKSALGAIKINKIYDFLNVNYLLWFV